MSTIPPDLHWACRRGMLELDILLGNFLREAYIGLSKPDQAIFVSLLSCQDQDLFMWLTGKEVSPQPQLQRMVECIRQHAKTRNSSSTL